MWQEWYEDGQLKSRYEYGANGEVINKFELLPDGAPHLLEGRHELDPETPRRLQLALDQKRGQ